MTRVPDALEAHAGWPPSLSEEMVQKTTNGAAADQNPPGWLDHPEEAAPTENNGTLGLLLDMELPLMIRFGSARMLLRDLMQLDTGSVVNLDPAPENAVELLVNERLVARGVVVSVRGNYGVRISEIAAPGEGFASALLGSLPQRERTES